MEQVVEFIGLALRYSFSLALSVGVLGAILYPILQMHLAMWRKAAGPYAGAFERSGNPSKLAGAAAIAERGIRWGMSTNQRQRVYPPVHVTVLPTGIGLQIMHPFRYGSKPLILPFSEMELASTKWALWGDPVAIRMKQLDGIDIILYREIMEWAAEQSPSIAAMMVKANPALNRPVIS
uniref:hypothetical protein n=1 Tax=Parerythrobacter lutipelagi TaxID=1964208 RepID=UPI0010F7C4FA|nr:hypothetical protein [Parerythrobacter lutipelagi]